MATSKRTRSSSRSKTVSRARGMAFGREHIALTGGFTPFSTWSEVASHPGPLYYWAPMDIRPLRVDAVQRFKNGKLRIRVGQTSFTADSGHLDRFFHKGAHGMATGRTHTATERAAFDRGYDAGNYANAYVSESLSKAWKVTTTKPDASVRAAMKASPKSFKHGFILGFFSSYEDSEVPATYQDEFFDAVAAWGRPD